LAETGQAESALQTAVGIDGPGWRARALAKVARALANTAQAEAAEAAGQALQAATLIKDPGGRANVLSRVARALAETGQSEAAVDASRQALQAATDINDPRRRASELAVLLANPVVCSSSGHEVGTRALELLLMTPDAPDHLAVFPVALLHRLVTNGHLPGS
jgi:hypothetical protein